MPTHIEVARNWAKQTGKGKRGFRVFYDGEIIFSYGRHFPIAKLTPQGILFTSRSASVSTAKHKSIVRRVAGDVFTVPNVLANSREEHERNYLAIMGESGAAEDKAKRARVYGPMHLERAEELRRMATRYREAFLG